jgi:CRISPR/Cas system-associated exonuclease Cas4 (RecB family)
MDLVIKKYFEQYRGTLPPELEDKINGRLMSDQSLLNKWRDWRTGLKYTREDLDAELFGALDDCLTDGQYHIPLDYKTRGYPPNEGDSEKYYQTQLDAYSLLLAKNGYKTKDCAYLVYYYPQEVRSDGVVIFNIKPVKVATDRNRASSVFEDAVQLLKGPIPKHHSKCEHCSWISSRIAYE